MKMEERECTVCGTAYKAQTSRQLYCSPNCKFKAYRTRNPEKMKETYRRQDLAKNYGITVERYEELLKQQNFSCAICGKTTSGSSKENFHVDHDHETGEVRGLLCHGCNTGIGSLNDDPVLLLKAADYLVNIKSKEYSL